MIGHIYKKLFDADGEAPPPDEHFQIPDDHYSAMGKVADAWSDLEFEIDQLIWQLMQIDQVFGACITAQLISIHPRMNALRSLCKLWEISKSPLDDLGKFYGRASTLSEKRNRLIHDKRMVWWKTREVVRFEVSAKGKGGPKFGPIGETIAYLMGFVADVQTEHRTFISIRNAILAELSASQGKPRGPYPNITQAKDQKSNPPSTT